MRILCLFVASGCLSMAQEKAPEGVAFKEPGHECSDSYAVPVVATMVAGVGAFMWMNDASGDDEEEGFIDINPLPLLYVPLTLVFGFDAMFSFGNASTCRAYMRMQEKLARQQRMAPPR